MVTTNRSLDEQEQASGRAYSDPIQLTLNGGALVVPGGGSITSDPIDRGGYNAMLLDWISGTMTKIQPIFCSTVNGVYHPLSLGVDGVGTPPTLGNCDFSATYPFREIGISTEYAGGYTNHPILGRRWVKFICTGTAAETLVINIVLATNE